MADRYTHDEQLAALNRWRPMRLVDFISVKSDPAEADFVGALTEAVNNGLDGVAFCHPIFTCTHPDFNGPTKS